TVNSIVTVAERVVSVRLLAATRTVGSPSFRALTGSGSFPCGDVVSRQLSPRLDWTLPIT
ncbi:hypothetical protein PspLS_01996, partial [Pyricularia sp. CBS 133598]